MGFDFKSIEAGVLARRNFNPISKWGFRELAVNNKFFHYALVREGREDLDDMRAWREVKTLGNTARICELEGKRIIARHLDRDKCADAFFSLHTLHFACLCTTVEQPLALFFAKDGPDLLVTELVEGSSLYSAYYAGELGPKSREAYLSVARAAAAVHTNNFMHMHLHPRNIMWNGEEARIVDPKHITFVPFSYNNLPKFLHEISFFIATAMNGWRSEYSITLIHREDEARDCMHEYLAACGLAGELDRAVATMVAVRAEIAYNASQQHER